jgi:hypothetical protein
LQAVGRVEVVTRTALCFHTKPIPALVDSRGLVPAMSRDIQVPQDADRGLR